jgi:hypothetical protein
MNSAQVSTLLDVLLSHRGPKGNKTDAAEPGKGRPMNWDVPDLRGLNRWYA